IYRLEIKLNYGEMMKNIMFLLSLLFLISVAGPSSAQDSTSTKRTVAVLYFDNNSLTKKEEMEPLRKGLADMLITELSKVNQFQVVERAHLQQILEEMSLGQSGALDNNTAQQVGQMLGAKNLILGSYMMMFDGKLRIDVRLVETETGITLKAEEETDSPKNLSAMVDKLVQKSLNSMNVRLNKNESKMLGQKDNKNFDAALYFARGLEYEDAKDFENARKMYVKALKANPKFIRAKTRLRNLPRRPNNR
ncbi:hypothetical protein JXO59_12695, partial [candidate division KSB1 bacterium]|nr:hypothetical protein [candidate division KSB1 bacterium]